MYNNIKKRPKIFKRLLWLDLWLFDKIIIKIKETENTRLNWEVRWRKSNLSIEDQLILMLMYLRSYTTYFYLWSILWVDESNAQRISIKIENIIIKCWLFSLPKKSILQSELETIIIDATEVQINRPKKKQRKYYSWKKKKHTLKAQVIISQKWQILRTNFAKWSTHDKKLYDQSKVNINDKTEKLMDSWYQWVQNDKNNVVIPYKKPKKWKLTKNEKIHNENLSRRRIKVENKLAEVKVFDILDEKYRNWRRRFWLRFNLICGIVNYNNWFIN